MNKNMVMILGGALFIAFFVAMMVQSLLSPKEVAKEAPVGVEVLVASRSLKTGETLKEKDIRWESFSEKSLFTGMIKRKDQADEKKLEVYGNPLRRNIESGEPITRQALVTDIKGSGNFLSASISPGMRAVAISVKAETTAGGFIAPGDYVDVILSYKLRLKGQAAHYSDDTIQNFASETILSNVRILAVDQKARDEKREAKVGRTVTMEVTKEGAQVLAMANAMGAITLSLRRLGEKDTRKDKRTPLTTDVNTMKVVQEVYDVMDKTKTKSNTVRLYSGSTVVNVPVRAKD